MTSFFRLGRISIALMTTGLVLLGCEKPSTTPPPPAAATSKPAPTPAEVDAAREAVKPALQPPRQTTGSGNADLPAGHPPMPSAPLVPAGEASAARQASTPLRFEPPGRWTAERPAGPSRISQYLIPPTIEGESPTRLVVTVFPNTGVMSEVEPNLERWKRSYKTADGQPLPDDQVTREDKTLAGHTATTVRLQGVSGGSTMSVNAPSAAAEMRLVATMIAHGERVYFLKLEGPIAGVKAAEAEFDQLLTTLRFE